MCREVCRAITFINYHIPVKEIREEQIEYSAIGFFDGMKTEEIPLEFAKDDFKPLWKHTMHNTKTNAGHYSYHNVFAFSNDEWNQHSDQQFWGDEHNKDFPLTFVVFLQLQNYETGDDAIKQRCINFSEVASGVLKEDGIVYSYYTIDKNDFVVCIKCLHYSTAVEAIKQLHNIEQTVIYSYSVFVISNKVLAELSETNYPALYEQIIDSICLKGITNSIDPKQKIPLGQKYSELCTRLADELYGKKKEDNELYDILGDDDFRFIARKVNLGRLLAQFSEGGLLCYSDRELQFYLFSSNLVLNTKTPEYKRYNVLENQTIKDKFLEDPTGVRNRKASPKCDELEKILKTIIFNNCKESDFEGAEETAAYLYAIWQLLQSLKALEMAPTKKYDFRSLYHPLSMLINILNEKTNLSDCPLLHEFIHKISMTLHGTLRTDIQFFQIRDFNVIVHYAPSKLRAFYSLWAIKVKNFFGELYVTEGELNGQRDSKSHQYSFVFSPGMFKEVSVKQLYESYDENKRLMLITAPERYLYFFRWTPLILVHEVSHFVGSKVRSRAKRHEIWLKCCGRVLTLEMEYFRYKSIESDATGYNLCDCLEKAVVTAPFYNDLIDQLVRDEEHVRHNEGKMYPYHSRNSKEIIMRTFRRTVCTDMEHLVSNDSGTLLLTMKQQLNFNNKSMEEQLKLGSYLQKITYGRDDNLRAFVSKFQTDLLSQLLDVFKYLTIESHADLMAVLTLRITPEAYLRSFTDSSVMSHIGDDNADCNNTLTVRVGLVIEAISKSLQEEEGFTDTEFVKIWSGNVTRDLADTINVTEAAGRLALSVYSYCESCKSTDKLTAIRNYQPLYDRKQRAFLNKQFDFLNDKLIWDFLGAYLQSCAKEYIKKVDTDEKLSKMQKELELSYKKVTGDSIIGSVQMIENFLADFEKNID